jgi:hypothetical protein
MLELHAESCLMDASSAKQKQTASHSIDFDSKFRRKTGKSANQAWGQCDPGDAL